MKLFDYTKTSKIRRKLTNIKQFETGHDNDQFQQFPEEPEAKQEFIKETITDTQGLDKAYENRNYFIHGNTLYIAGANSWRDVWDDISKVPFYGDLKQSERYKEAEKALKQNPQIKHVIGHSLGGSVALELEKNFPKQIESSRTYGAPVLDLTEHEMDPRVQRYRNMLDPVAVFDNAANVSVNFNPFASKTLTHSYANISNNFTSSEERPAASVNRDGSVSLIG
jgi:pimeloyl-ACP methyl ester carboxylesterase